MPNWSDVLQDVDRIRQIGLVQARNAVDIIRRQYLQRLQAHTGRNVIAYYSGWLSKPGILQTDINDEDKNGFMMAVHRLDRSLGLDLIIHTPGGSIAATQSIVDYLHRMFPSTTLGADIRAIVPQIAMSAGTMLACSCRSIVMSNHSNLGPIDPHVDGLPAYGIIAEFKRAYREIQKDPDKLHVWRPILNQYQPGLLGQCQNAIGWSNSFVSEQLRKVMFLGDPQAAPKAQSIVRKLSASASKKTHSRHIHVDECDAMGLTVERLEADPALQDLVLTVHHCYMHSLMNTPAFKMIENHLGAAMVKQQATATLLQQQI
jgi:hypothetical protein